MWGMIKKIGTGSRRLALASVTAGQSERVLGIVDGAADKMEKTTSPLLFRDVVELVRSIIHIAEMVKAHGLTEI